MLSQKIKGIQENVKKEEEDKRRSIDEIRWIEEEKLRLEQEDKERREKVQHQFRMAKIDIANKMNTQNKKIEENLKLFRENYSRNPLKEELQESLTGLVDDDIINKFLDRYNPNVGEDNV
jgi:hypothetical protein